MIDTGLDNIAVLRVGTDVLQRFASAQSEAPEGFSVIVGDDGALFGYRAAGDAALVTILTKIDGPDELGKRLRSGLGSVLDAHIDLRGILLISVHDATKAQNYDEFAALNVGTWIPKPLGAEPAGAAAGWSFANAAAAFSMPGTRKRIDAKEDSSDSTGNANPLEQVEGKLNEVFAARDDRGALRRTLSAALENSLDAPAPDADSEKEAAALDGVLSQGVSGSPDTLNAFEAMLRKVGGKDEEGEGGEKQT